MELSGEEKKLQALFSELKAVDEETAPRFATMWNRATPKPRRVRTFNPALVAATALLVCAILSIAVWTRRRQVQTPPQVVHVERPAAPKTENQAAAPVASATVAPVKENNTPRRNRFRLRHAAQLAANRKLSREAKAISDWESPTWALLSSPTDSLFSSLPQLNENSNGLQSYLPSRPN